MSTAPPTALCSAWITGEDADRCGDSLVSNAADLDDAAYDASWLLYTLTGSTYPGVCERTVRPCRQACTCFGPYSSAAVAAWYWNDLGGGSFWRDECGGGQCGCGVESRVRLAGHVREILEVKIAGVVVDAAEYRVDLDEWLVRLDDPGPPLRKRFWPACQNTSLPDTETGTFSVTYTWGAELPPGGKMAAAQLARELWKACTAGAGPCALPTKVTKVVRQGVTTERIATIASLLRSGSSGIPLVDAFIAAVNPRAAGRPPMVWSPDVQAYARREG